MASSTKRELPDHPVIESLAPGETVRALIDAPTARLLVTDRRLAVADQTRIALDVPLEGIRRIQFDIERQRPATFVIVPEHPQHEPQVLAIPLELYDRVAEVIAFIGQALYGPQPEP